ncbi:MAG: 3'(2'),5'-bisphosphate nucleotidase CysQ [Myxococcota bacterium]|nr:3'(2'),5'-bisphosphate nucleotidase CysQ [Myxococcota bacterium]
MTSPPTYRDELGFALDVAREAGRLIARFYRDGAKTWQKSENNPVTEADLAADACIRKAIADAHPEDGLLTEESEDDLRRLDCARVWIVDPIDGTREFTRQIPEFAVSIGLVVEGEPVLGVVHNPAVDVTVAGALGGGVTRNGEPARVSQCASLAAARVVASRSEHRDGMLEGLESQFASLRPTGSIAWKLALVACGDADFNLSLKPKHEWDVCAGDFLVHEAGGAYVDFDGRRARYNRRDAVREASMIAGPRPLVEAFMALEEARPARS